MSALFRLRAGRAAGWFSIWTTIGVSLASFASPTGIPERGQSVAIGLGVGEGERVGEALGVALALALGVLDGVAEMLAATSPLDVPPPKTKKAPAPRRRAATATPMRMGLLRR
jgi:hypothetical protein